MPKRLNSLKFYYNKNGNPAGNLYDATLLIKIKREFLFILDKESLNRFSQWRPNGKQLPKSMPTWNAYLRDDNVYLLSYQRRIKAYAELN